MCSSGSRSILILNLKTFGMIYLIKIGWFWDWFDFIWKIYTNYLRWLKQLEYLNRLTSMHYPISSINLVDKLKYSNIIHSCMTYYGCDCFYNITKCPKHLLQCDRIALKTIVSLSVLLIETYFPTSTRSPIGMRPSNPVKLRSSWEMITLEEIFVSP